MNNYYVYEWYNVETVMSRIVVNVINVKIPSKVQRLSKTQPKELYDIIVLFCWK